MKNYVFGDTGGHKSALFSSLVKLGIDIKNGMIPEGTRIIHVGDLIHKGPGSSDILKTVDLLIRNNPGQWVQILGNHEFQHIKGSPVFWKCSCTSVDISIINRWFESGLAHASFGIDKITSIELEVSAKPKIEVPNKGILFAHGGLTKTWWDILGNVKSPSELSAILNGLDARTITSPGQMLGYINPKVGPVWAIGNDEVFTSWPATSDMPFMQVHGHTVSYQWSRSKWFRSDPAFKPFRDNTKLNPMSRAVVTKVANSLLIGVDPGFSTYADLKEQPYLSFVS